MTASRSSSDNSNVHVISSWCLLSFPTRVKKLILEYTLNIFEYEIIRPWTLFESYRYCCYFYHGKWYSDTGTGFNMPSVHCDCGISSILSYDPLADLFHMYTTKWSSWDLQRGLLAHSSDFYVLIQAVFNHAWVTYESKDLWNCCPGILSMCASLRMYQFPLFYAESSVYNFCCVWGQVNGRTSQRKPTNHKERETNGVWPHFHGIHTPPCLQVPFPELWLWGLFCDPSSFTRAICVTEGGGTINGYTTEGSYFALPSIYQ